MTVFSSPGFDQHELVAFGSDSKAGLSAIIAVHNSTLGPGLGGCRMYPYASDADALLDVLRLSRGMTFKSALAGLPLGGGKSVIIGDSRRDKTPELMRAMGDFIHSQSGRYIAAEDSGTGVADMHLMAERTPYVSGIAESAHGGDPSPSTALGVFLSIQTAVRNTLHRENCNGLRVAIQGLGNVGFHLAQLLRDAGATVYGSDINTANLQKAEQQLGVLPVSVNDILGLEVDVLAPCAMGAILNAITIPKLRARIVAGGANNQLASDLDGEKLQQHGIVYCPDFLINAGGIIDIHHQRAGSTDMQKSAHINHIATTLEEVLKRAAEGQRPTQEISEELAKEILQQGARKTPAALKVSN
jgi:leucine dehydrogenase